jgi:hypothetical protein
LRAATSLACLLRDQGRSTDAVACLRLIYDRFTDGFDTADLIAAKTASGSDWALALAAKIQLRRLQLRPQDTRQTFTFSICAYCAVVSGRQPLNRLARPLIFRLSNRRGGFKE